MTAGNLRLQPEDSTYWFLRRAFGWSVVLQLVWRLPERPDPKTLTEWNGAIGRGVLGRRLRTARAPLARPRWEHVDQAPELTIDAAEIPEDAVDRWARDEMYGVSLDPEEGPTWRLHAAPVADGGSVVSLTTLHLVADGRTMVTAALESLSGSGIDLIAGSQADGLAQDVADSARQLLDAMVGVGRTITAILRDRDREHVVKPSRTPAHERAPAARGSWVTVSVSSEQWQLVAKRHGGTANTLFVAVLAGALRKSGYAPPGTPLEVGIPVSRRVANDSRGNATAGVSVVLTDDPTPDGDLTSIRRKCKVAFTRLAAGHRAPHIHLLPLMRLLPISLVVRAVSSGSGMPDVVASNVGEFGSQLLKVGGTTATEVAFRGIAQGVDAAQPYRFGDGVQSWLLDVAGTLTFSVVAFDEQHIPGDDVLRRLLRDELDRREIPHRVW